MKKVVIFFSNHSQSIFFIFILVGIFFFVRNKVNKTKKEGIITVAKVIRFEGAESGSNLYVDIFFKDKIYSTSLGDGCRADCVSKYFFIKISEDSPTDYAVLYGDKPVPSCIIENVKHFNGWKDFPDCSNYVGSLSN